jgi:hypothetical protein
LTNVDSYRASSTPSVRQTLAIRLKTPTSLSTTFPAEWEQRKSPTSFLSSSDAHRVPPHSYMDLSASFSASSAAVDAPLTPVKTTSSSSSGTATAMSGSAASTAVSTATSSSSSSSSSGVSYSTVIVLHGIVAGVTWYVRSFLPSMISLIWTSLCRVVLAPLGVVRASSSRLQLPPFLPL